MLLLLSSIALSADVAWYADTDGDGFGDGGDFVIADDGAGPAGYVRSDADCNDNDNDISPNEQESCNGYDDDCDGIIDGTDACSLCSYGMFEDHQYAVCGLGGSDFIRTWRSARDFCRTIPYDLVSINSAAEDAYVLSRVRAEDSGIQYWIGLNDRGNGQEGDFFWSDGSPFQGASYSNWGGGEPNNSGNEDCVTTNGNSAGQWNDLTCFAFTSFVCEAVGDPRPWWPDSDGDGFGDTAGLAIAAHAQPVGYAANAADCDDGSFSVKPGAAELCNGIDDNCNGIIDRDSGLFVTVYNDPDGDGFGSGEPFESCADVDGLSAVGTDCLEGDPLSFPGADEFCNGIDNDCDGTPDNSAVDQSEWFSDEDGDGFGFGNARLACNQPQGAVINDADCDDFDGEINPDADEVCDGQDNNCDQVVDDDAVDKGTWFVDFDGDDFGDDNQPLSDCEQPDGTVGPGGDCDDMDASTYPGAPELPDGLDNDCDGFPEDPDPDTDTEDPDTDPDTDTGDPDTGDPDTDDPDTDRTVTSSRQFVPDQSGAEVPSGCSCTTGPSGASGWAVFGLLGLLAAVRRRSHHGH